MHGTARVLVAEPESWHPCFAAAGGTLAKPQDRNAFGAQRVPHG